MSESLKLIAGTAVIVGMLLLSLVGVVHFYQNAKTQMQERQAAKITEPENNPTYSSTIDLIRAQFEKD